MQDLKTKFLEENIGHKLLDIGLDNDFFFGLDTKEKGNKSKNKQMGLHHIGNFCTAKETINKVKSQPTEWEKIVTNHISDKELISKIYKDQAQGNSKKAKPV